MHEDKEFPSDTELGDGEIEIEFVDDESALNPAEEGSPQGLEVAVHRPAALAGVVEYFDEVVLRVGGTDRRHFVAAQLDQQPRLRGRDRFALRDAFPADVDHRRTLDRHATGPRECRIDADYDERGEQTAMQCWARTDHDEYEITGDVAAAIYGEESFLLDGGDALFLSPDGEAWSEIAAATAFGAIPEVEHAVDLVRRAHRPVHGTSHRGLSYSAGRPAQAAWVHNVLTDSFLATHRVFGRGTFRADDVVAVGLVDGDHVGDFDDALLDALQIIAAAGQEQH